VDKQKQMKKGSRSTGQEHPNRYCNELNWLIGGRGSTVGKLVMEVGGKYNEW